jgi:hypothetical protein
MNPPQEGMNGRRFLVSVGSVGQLCGIVRGIEQRAPDQSWQLGICLSVFKGKTVYSG